MKNPVIVVILMASIFSFTSCAKKISFLVSVDVPAARGSVKVSRDVNKNYIIHLNVSNLAEVERLQPSKKVYVVWMTTDNDATINLGQIISSKKGFSKLLTVTFKTTSAFKPSKIFITAEDNAVIQYPQSSTILSTDRF